MCWGCSGSPAVRAGHGAGGGWGPRPRGEKGQPVLLSKPGGKEELFVLSRGLTQREKGKRFPPSRGTRSGDAAGQGTEPAPGCATLGAGVQPGVVTQPPGECPELGVQPPTLLKGRCWHAPRCSPHHPIPCVCSHGNGTGWIPGHSMGGLQSSPQPIFPLSSVAPVVLRASWRRWWECVPGGAVVLGRRAWDSSTQGWGKDRGEWLHTDREQV